MAQFDVIYTHSKITIMDIIDNKFLNEVKNDDGKFYAIESTMDVRSNGD